ncbi:MAG: hypothetical protein JST76_04905, partial [Bacteroidetes bacterium]|nr:hypothetical protein [Bacteroidota bacterium]
MKKKLTLWIIILLPVLAWAQQDTVVHAKPKPQKTVKARATNTNQQNQPIPDETRPDFNNESLFKALFVGGLNLSQVDGD